MAVGSELAGRPKTLKLRATPRNVEVRKAPRYEHTAKPTVLKALRNGFNGQRAGNDFAIRPDSHKSEQCRPCDPDASSPTETPATKPRLLVNRDRRYARERERLRRAESCVLPA